MCDYYNQNQYYLIRVPNVLNSFEATTAAIGVAVILLSVLLIRSLRLPCNDSSKPFLLMLSLGMALATVASIVLFLYRTCYLSTDFGLVASMIEDVGRFASVNSLLFGGGLILLGASNTVSTDGNVAAGRTWFLHIAITLISVVVGALCQRFFSELAFIPAFVFYVLPVFGFIVLIVGLAVGYCRARKTSSSESTEKSPFCSLVCFLAAPVILVLAARLLDDYDVLQRVLTHYIRGFKNDRDDWLGIYEAIRAQPVIKGVGVEQWELILPVVVVLSALVFHPSVRCCRSVDKSKIAPSFDGASQAPQTLIPGWSMTTPSQMLYHSNMIMVPQTPVNCTVPTIHTPNSLIMSPMVAAHPMDSFPMMHSPLQPCNINRVPPVVHSIADFDSHSSIASHHTQVPAFQQHAQMHGMGGRAVYLMA